jgi:hypothetical protein
VSKSKSLSANQADSGLGSPEPLLKPEFWRGFGFILDIVKKFIIILV